LRKKKETGIELFFEGSIILKGKDRITGIRMRKEESGVLTGIKGRRGVKIY